MVGTNNLMALRRKAKDPALSSAGELIFLLLLQVRVIWRST